MGGTYRQTRRAVAAGFRAPVYAGIRRVGSRLRSRVAGFPQDAIGYGVRL
jgi:hypothetical protein